MTLHVILYKAECKSCDSTGLYVGFGEQDGSAVVCKECNGTGCVEKTISYTDFVKRKKKRGIKRVFHSNPGIAIGVGKDDKGNKFKLEDFGGISTSDFYSGKNFPKGSEMRKYVCPAWWYQGVNYKLKPNWNECISCGSFSACSSFKKKEKCWERFDKENK